MADPRQGWRSDQGTTLVEVMVVMAISALVVPALYMAIASGFRQDAQQEIASVAEADVRRVSTHIRADVQQSWPVDDGRGNGDTQLMLEFFDDDGTRTSIVWFARGDALVRRVTKPLSNRTVSELTVLEGLASAPSFTYWTAQGTEIIGQNIANCSVRVTVEFATSDERGGAATSFDVTHRLRDPEVEPC